MPRQIGRRVVMAMLLEPGSRRYPGNRMTRKQLLMLSSMEAGASPAEAGGGWRPPGPVHPDWDMFEAQTYPEWVDTS